MELYDTNKDWSQANNLAKQMPEKLHALQRLWLIEATRYNVLPLDDDLAKKMNADTSGRPKLIKGKTQLLFSGMGRLSENCVLNIKNRSHSITAQIWYPMGAAVRASSSARVAISVAGACMPRAASSSIATTSAVYGTSTSSRRVLFPQASTRSVWNLPMPAVGWAKAAR